jgi:hypothetical protein
MGKPLCQHALLLDICIWPAGDGVDGKCIVRVFQYTGRLGTAHCFNPLPVDWWNRADSAEIEGEEGEEG